MSTSVSDVGRTRGTAPRALRRSLDALAGVSSATILLVTVVAFVLAWEVVSRTALVDPAFISRPSAIVAALPELYSSARVQSALKATGTAMGLAFLYGTLAGLVLGYALGFSRTLRDAFYGPALFLLSVPKSIFIPIFLVFFGINTRTAIYYGAFSSYIYVLVNVVGGFDLIEDRHLKIAEAYGASRRHRMIDVVFPASLPGVFTGIWYGLKSALQGVLILELFISVGGLGSVITFYTNALRVDLVFGLILGISVTAIVLGSAWNRVERALSRWRPRADVAAVTQIQT